MTRKEEAIIEIKNLNVWYGTTKALNHVNMNIYKNKITAFIGPSGCGKTTLLRCFNRMNDLVKSFKLEGTVKIDGDDIYERKQDVIAIRRKTGMVFQQPNPFPMSIYDNFKLPIKENSHQRIGKKRIREIAIESLKAAHLYDEVQSRMHESALRLSGGQQQRLCIARALVIQPEIILFDEPCSALDPISTMKIEDLLEDLKEKYTIVIVTHNLEQARRIADYVAFFYQGDIIEQNTSEKIFTSPQSEKTRDYLMGVF